MSDTNTAHNVQTDTHAHAPGGFTHPDRIVQNLHIPEGAHVADFGSGSGYFTIYIAKIVGPDGSVTAVDVQRPPLEVVEARSRGAGLFNVRTVHANLEKEEGSGLPSASQDIVLLANVLFQSQKKDAIVREAKRVLKGGGGLVMIDWKRAVPFGPAGEGFKLSREEGRELAEKSGFTFVKEFAASINHWGLLFKKP